MKKPRIDFKVIAARALERIEAVCVNWLPAGKKAGHEWEIGDRHGAPGQSLKIHLSGSKAGMWSDFSTDDKGGDLVSLVAYVDACTQLEAARKLAAFLGIAESDADTKATPTASKPTTTKTAAKAAPEWRPILPVPDGAPDHPAAHPKHGKPDRLHSYRDTEGRALGFVARWEAGPNRQKKEFGWLVFAEGNGRREWRWQGFPVPRPLYGLDAMGERPAAPVVLYEGEKAAEAGRELLPDHIGLTWPGGSKAADKANFSPIKGRDVILWADADTPGREAMKTAAKLARKAGAASIAWLNLPLFATLAPGHDADGMAVLTETVRELPEGWDAADALAEGWTADHLGLLMTRPDALLEAKQAATAPAFGSADMGEADAPAQGSRFTVTDAGLFYFEPGRDGADSRQVRVSDKLEITALARDEESAGWSTVLAFKDMDGHMRQEIIPRRLFMGDGTDGPKQLADLGLFIEPGRPPLERLKAFIASSRPEKRARLVDQTGWHGGSYLFPDGQIGDGKEALVYRGSKRALGVFTPRGKLADWQEQIGAMAVDNPRLCFTLSAAFAGPLLLPCGGPSFAFHWTGDSSTGKSGCLYAAGSVWGNPSGVVHSWRHTDNALEYTASQHNDGLLILDELKEVDPKQAGAIAYMLGNSKGKGRAHHAGGLREALTWRIAMLSSGEIGLADHMASAGQKSHAGQSVRFIELPSNAGDGLGMWNALHHLPDGRSFTDHLKAAAGRYYGTPGRAFIKYLGLNLDTVANTAKRLEEMFFRVYVPADAGGQVRRVAGAFAMVAAAGELAAQWKVCPWPAEYASESAGLLFREWLDGRPTSGNLEDAQILSHVRQLMERNWQARFIDWHRVTEDNADLSRMAAVHDALGFRKDTSKKKTEPDEDAPYKEEKPEPNYLFYVTRGRFQEEFAAKGGFKFKRVAAVLKARGILKCDPDGTTWRETLPNGDTRSYCISGRRLWEVTGND